MDNEKELDAHNKVIFLGNSKAYKEHRVVHMNFEYDKFGMQCGWFVDQAFIHVRTLKSNERESFIKHYCECYNKYEFVAKTYKTNNEHNASDIAKVLGICNAPKIMRWGLPNIMCWGLPQIIAGAALFGAAKGADKFATYRALIRFQALSSPPTIPCRQCTRRQRLCPGVLQ